MQKVDYEIAEKTSIQYKMVLAMGIPAKSHLSWRQAGLEVSTCKEEEASYC
jgi:hypothetical protein